MTTRSTDPQSAEGAGLPAVRAPDGPEVPPSSPGQGDAGDEPGAGHPGERVHAEDSVSRRGVLSLGAALTGGALLLASAEEARAQTGTTPSRGRPSARDWRAPGLPGRDYTPVVVPNGAKLPWKIVDGVKVFHLVAEEVEHAFAPGLTAHCWGYNGRVHGPTIELVDGDRFRIYVTNRLPAGTTVHWHGMLLPNGMDGVGGLNQKVIRPGETFRYEFTIRGPGTFMYHSHHDEMTQMALGMVGMVIVHPRRREAPRIDRDFAIMLHEWKIDAGTRRPDPREMIEFNVLTMNAKVFPATEPLVARLGERVRIRFGNLSATDHHPIHLHGHHFRVTGTDAGPVPVSAQLPETTVLVPVGATRSIEFVADAPGDWALHCHMTHHLMNQMGHEAPNLVGVDTTGLDAKVQQVLPGYMSMGQTGMDMSEHAAHMKMPENSIPMLPVKGKHDTITMGGMFSVLKVRERLDGYGDPGGYENPPGTVASRATADELQRDGIDVRRPAPALPGGLAQ